MPNGVALSIPGWVKIPAGRQALIFAEQQVMQQGVHAGRHVVRVKIPARVEVGVRRSPLGPAHRAEMLNWIDPSRDYIGHDDGKCAGIDQAQSANQINLRAGPPPLLPAGPLRIMRMGVDAGCGHVWVGS